MKRRKFIQDTTIAMAAGMSLPYTVLSNPLRTSANDKVNVGVIGCNGMGWSNVQALLKQSDVDLVAICDVDSNVVAKRKADYAALRKNVPTTYSDYRELLRNKSIDAVVIGTPDHWHCKIMVDAVTAGKHVYVE